MCQSQGTDGTEALASPAALAAWCSVFAVDRTACSSTARAVSASFCRLAISASSTTASVVSFARWVDHAAEFVTVRPPSSRTTKTRYGAPRGRWCPPCSTRTGSVRRRPSRARAALQPMTGRVQRGILHHVEFRLRLVVIVAQVQREQVTIRQQRRGLGPVAVRSRRRRLGSQPRQTGLQLDNLPFDLGLLRGERGAAASALLRSSARSPPVNASLCKRTTRLMRRVSSRSLSPCNPSDSKNATSSPVRGS